MKVLEDFWKFISPRQHEISKNQESISTKIDQIREISQATHKIVSGHQDELRKLAKSMKQGFNHTDNASDRKAKTKKRAIK